MRGFSLDSSRIALALARAGHAHRCGQCDRPMHVRYRSGLCVYCFNAQRELEAFAAPPPAEPPPALRPPCLLPATSTTLH